MSTDKLKLDSRLSMQPSEFFMKHTRHGQGRNRTLIEDSSLLNKFDSLMDLIDKQQRIYSYASDTADKHQVKINALDALLSNPQAPLSQEQRKELEKQKEQVTELKNDAIKIRDAMDDRINKIMEVFPKVRNGQPITWQHVKQSLVLEKLLHNPTLFTDDGRPYKNPWTYRQKNTVKSIEFTSGAHNEVLLKFDKSLSEDMIGFLQRQGCQSIDLRSSKEVTMSTADFLNLNERMLHPESQTQMQDGINYIDQRDLSVIGTAYGKAKQSDITHLMRCYQGVMTKEKYTQEHRLNAIRNTQIHLQRYMNAADDKGFGMHVMKKLQFDIQQRLQAMMNPMQKPGNLNQAFEAALKLDQVALFNKVVAEAVTQNRLNDPQFANFLQACIQQEGQANDHDQAINASNFIGNQANQVIQALRIPPVIVLEHVEDNELDDINPLEVRIDELEVQQSSHMQHSVSQPVIEQTTENEVTVHTDNKEPTGTNFEM